MSTPIFRTTVFLFAALAATLTTALSAGASTSRITELIGHPVVTDAGKQLGKIEDLAIDPSNGQVSFVVISIGSFLIENSLIAVEPSALAPAAKGEPIVLRTEDLEVAHRFNADNWPAAADVRPATLADSTSETGSNDDASSPSTPLTSTGSATITAGTKKATFEGGKREIINGPIRRAKTEAKPKSVAKVIPNFKNLDRNRDGRLSRTEIGAHMNQKSGFQDLDADANGSIDDFEYAAYLERVAGERRWAGNR